MNKNKTIVILVMIFLIIIVIIGGKFIFKNLYSRQTNDYPKYITSFSDEDIKEIESSLGIDLPNDAIIEKELISSGKDNGICILVSKYKFDVSDFNVKITNSTSYEEEYININKQTVTTNTTLLTIDKGKHIYIREYDGYVEISS